MPAKRALWLHASGLAETCLDLIRGSFKAKLEKILHTPRIEANRLRGFPGCYKIKLRQSGYRLIYQVREQEVMVFVVAIGKRDREKAYAAADLRLKSD